MTRLVKVHQGSRELPAEILSRLHVTEDATFLAECDPETGSITLRKIDPEQAWFWTEEWQKGEREAEADLAAGRSKKFNSSEEFLASFD